MFSWGMSNAPAGPFKNTALETAIAISGFSQRDLAYRSGIGESRISEIKKQTGRPPTEAEKASFAKALGTPAHLLFPPTGPVYVEKSGASHFGPQGIQAQAAATAAIIEKWLGDSTVNWAGHESQRFNLVAGLLQLRHAAGLDKIR
jgi:transcriptional regulator with XRE-family HTH domain